MLPSPRLMGLGQVELGDVGAWVQPARVDVGRRRDARAGKLVAHDLGELHLWLACASLSGGDEYRTWKPR